MAASLTSSVAFRFCALVADFASSIRSAIPMALQIVGVDLVAGSTIDLLFTHRIEPESIQVRKLPAVVGFSISKTTAGAEIISIKNGNNMLLKYSEINPRAPKKEIEKLQIKLKENRP